MTRAWPWLVLVAFFGGKPTAVFAQLKLMVKEKPSVAVKNVTGPSGNSRPATFSSDGKMLAAESDNSGWIVVANTLTGKEDAEFLAHRDEITFLAFSPDGSMLATGSINVIKIWDTKTWKQTVVLRWNGRLSSMVFSPDSKTLAVMYSWSRQDRDSIGSGICLMETATGKERAELVERRWLNQTADIPRQSGRLAFSPDGKTLAVQSPTDELSLWNMETERRRKMKLIPSSSSFAFSPDSKLLHTYLKKAQAWDAENGTEKPAFEGPVQPLAFSPDGKVLAALTEKGLELLASDSRKRLATLQSDKSPVPLVFSGGGKILTALNSSNQIKTWELTWEKEPGK